METDIRTIGEWYRDNRETIDAWLTEYNIGSFYGLSIADKQKIYDFINKEKEVTLH